MADRSKTKLEQLLRLEQLLLAHPDGLRKAEIARRLGVHRSTVTGYIDDLEHIAPVYEPLPGHYAINRDAYKVKVLLTLDEAVALHLASRLLTTRTDKHYPHAAKALRALGVALEEIAPLVSDHLRRSAGALDGPQRRQDPAFMDVLEQLTRAWASRRKVRLTHQLEDGAVHSYTFAPYFIEPYAIGRTLHVIGWREPPAALRTFKIERIRSIELLDQPYDIPSDFDAGVQLSDAWGIWFSDRAPQEVVLQFSPRVAHRVRETQWHHAEQLRELDDGAVEWRTPIAAWQEMLPWIRGWGADVKVLAPDALRETVLRGVQELAGLYGVAETSTQGVAYYAHSKPGIEKAHWQPLREHLQNSAELARQFGADAGISELAATAALFHDIGKYSQAFQDRLDGSRRKVDHATAGAREITTLFKDTPHKFLAEILAYCIAGHHTGLPNYGSQADMEGEGTLLARLAKSNLEEYSAYKTEIDPGMLTLPDRVPIRPIKNYKGQQLPGFSLSFLARMVFSALVDADYQETESYMQGKRPHGEHPSIEALCHTFNQFLKKFDHPTEEINKKRTQILKSCVSHASRPPGFFSLTVPTGGGKTFASMGFALNHAVENNLKRIIYVIPFTSIIEQNANEFRTCLGEENVLEHHSNFDWQQKREGAGKLAGDQADSVYAKLKLAAENWDIPIVVTTNVQFFESLFANRSSRCRKLHNLAKSVIIFDEAQMLPLEFMEPCINAIQELVQNYGSSAVFCTATQPSLERFLAPDTPVTELAPDPQDLFDSFRRVYIKNMGRVADETLLAELQSHSQVLCIVNTRRHAKGLFEELFRCAGEGCLHLSTLMCPAHRKETLATIRRRLCEDQICRVISTQVMEAGIDIDFPVGYRAIAGLDSIIQAAGRVNREGRQERANIYVFHPETPFIKKSPAFVEQGAAVAGSVLRDFRDDPVSVEAIQSYFKMLYTLHHAQDFDAKLILPCFEKGTNDMDFDFRTAAERFKLIDNNTVPVIIPYNEEARRLITELKYTPYPLSTLRKLQSYSVNIYEHEFEKLQSKGVIETYDDRYEILSDEAWYDARSGLALPSDVGGNAIFFD